MRRFAEARGAFVVIAEEALRLGRWRGSSLCRSRARCGALWVRRDLDVAPEWRRGGLGRELLARAEEKVREAGVGRMGLHVAVDNEAAIRFYERLGYHVRRRGEAVLSRGWAGWVDLFSKEL